MNISLKLGEKTLSTNYFYRGKIVNVRQDWIEDAKGEKAFREVVEHPGAVAVLALEKKEQVVLVRQYRQPAGEVLLEIPAGKLEPGEEPLACARRELLEETGLTGTKWNQLCTFYPSPGFCDELIYLFMVEQLSNAEATSSDPEENIEIVILPLEEAWQQVVRGGIKDGKTIIALQFAMIQRT